MNVRLPVALLLSAVLACFFGCAQNGDPKKEGEDDHSGMKGPKKSEEGRVYKPEEMVRLTSAVVQPQVAKGEALLICAYDSDEKFERVRLEGAISLSAFREKLPTLAKDHPLVFY